MKPSPPSAGALRLSFAPGTRLDVQSDSVEIVGARRRLALGGPLAAMRPLIERLFDGATESELADSLPSPAQLPLLLYLLSKLESAGLIARSATGADGTRIATLVPIAGRRVVPAGDLPAGASWTLSRFAYLRREGEALVLESPQSEARLLAEHPAAAAILHRLARPASRADVAAAAGGDPAVAGQMLALLAGGGFLDPDEGREETEAERLWEFHDLLFHWHCRLGRREAPYGGVFPFAGEIEPLPSLKPAGPGATIDLPAWDEAAEPSASLAAVMRQRRSVRHHAAAPIALAQIGALLDRAARQIRTIETSGAELAARPYPAGGALYELELYLAVDRCDGLERGLYHYRPGEHRLERLDGAGRPVETLLDQAALTLAGTDRPQILLIVAARFQRLSLKYRAVTYALILKHVGVLYQTLYLVATDLGLAPCAMGGGDSALFAEATGLDPMVESSVGEFALGLPAEDAHAS